MTPTDFRARLKALGFTIRGFAAFTGIHYQTVRGWGSERAGRGMQPFPKWVGALLGLIEAEKE